MEEKEAITEGEKRAFEAFSFFLSKYNNQQKRAIISNDKEILCIAGAGTGKTTVLTKRIDFLIKFRTINPKDILAITFTRKAKEEMQERLRVLGHSNVNVQTFNSFSERTLLKNNDKIYNKKVRMISYTEKIKLLKEALNSFSLKIENAIDNYFTKQQRRGKGDDELFNILLNDVYFIVDYYKGKGHEIKDFSVKAKKPREAKMIYNICRYIDLMKKKHGLRDHMDQVVDTISFFKKHKEVIPKYPYILIDEYQDVNDLQIELIDLLDPENLFCVGDPRQSIFGWRGSNINYILNFKEKYPNAKVINLIHNYRSIKPIVNLMNSSIQRMKLANLNPVIEGDKEIKLVQFANENTEYEFITQSILASELPRNEIFVLARTNRQLKELSYLLNQRGIRHLLKNDERKANQEPSQDQLTLATVHAIKGLEAKQVFVIGCTYLNFPCRTAEHPVLDLIKVDEYDKDEEEQRLFYVALSRAKELLCLTYSGKTHTSYLTTDVLNKVKHIKSEIKLKNQSKLTSWYMRKDLEKYER